ncbi:hypothetical protein [Polaromonas sp.]
MLIAPEHVFIKNHQEQPAAMPQPPINATLIFNKLKALMARYIEA